MEALLINAIRMWLLTRRATGKQARIGREVAQQFSHSLIIYQRALGDDFRVRFPQLTYEMQCLMDKL